jgi:hypothetical protein
MNEKKNASIVQKFLKSANISKHLHYLLSAREDFVIDPTEVGAILKIAGINNSVAKGLDSDQQGKS